MIKIKLTVIHERLNPMKVCYTCTVDSDFIKIQLVSFCVRYGDFSCQIVYKKRRNMICVQENMLQITTSIPTDC